MAVRQIVRLGQSGVLTSLTTTMMVMMEEFDGLPLVPKHLGIMESLFGHRIATRVGGRVPPPGKEAKRWIALRNPGRLIDYR
ncbi:carbon starvation protein CstA [Anopheles sinensis]|uniref:Carbon starvation protein CstA n=1 Tax=Anopheles sinensis TaxID=74873 RepID=A0A084VCX0_ANOSI|nr:carbon starvation protein CstA [Anopheles sinensis]